MEGDHKLSYLLLVVFTSLLFLVVIAFNGLAGAGADAGGLFTNTTGGVSAVYYTDITPAGWTFSIWALIYTWQGLFLLYSLSTLCRRSPSYGYLYVTPGHQPPAVYISYCVNLLANISWILLWDRFLPQWSLLFAFLFPITLALALGFSCRALYNSTPVLERDGKYVDVWLTRLFTHNGLALYATWTVVALVINLDVVLVYIGKWQIPFAGTLSLLILFTLVIIWFFVDVFLLDRFTRYIIMTYPVLVWALTGSLINNWDLSASNWLLTAVLLSLSTLAALVKIGLTVARQFYKPLYPSHFPPEVTNFLGSSSSKHSRYGTVHYEPVSDA